MTPGSQQQLGPLLCLQTVNWTALEASLIQRVSGRPGENMLLSSKHLVLPLLSTAPSPHHSACCTKGLLQCLLLKPGTWKDLDSPLLHTHFLSVFIFELYPVSKGILPPANPGHHRSQGEACASGSGPASTLTLWVCSVKRAGQGKSLLPSRFGSSAKA